MNGLNRKLLVFYDYMTVTIRKAMNMYDCPQQKNGPSSKFNRKNMYDRWWWNQTGKILATVSQKVTWHIHGK